MQLLQPSTAVNGPSTLVTGTPAVSCLERLQLVAQATADRALRPESVAVLAQLALYVNADTGTAWPFQRTLGQRLGMARQNVGRALNQLEAQGYISRSSQNDGTVYRLIFPASGITHDACTGITGDARELSPVMPPVNTGVNPVTEQESPTVIPGGSGSGTTGGLPARQVARPQVLTLGYLPDDWEPSEELIARAMAVCQLTREQVAQQTERFRSHCRSKATRSADWREDWWRWVENVRPGARWRSQLLGQHGPPSYAEQRAMRDNVGRTEAVSAQMGGWGT